MPRKDNISLFLVNDCRGMGGHSYERYKSAEPPGDSRIHVLICTGTGRESLVTAIVGRDVIDDPEE